MADGLREGISGLYKSLTTTTVTDKTYERERLTVLARLKLVPQDVLLDSLGSTSQFDSGKAGLGLFARNRGLRQQKAPKKRETKSHREVVNDKQNLRKRLAYSKTLNGLVRDMGRHLNDEKGNNMIPDKVWTQYDRLQNDVKLKQVDAKDLDVVGGVTPGPGAYQIESSDRIMRITRSGGAFGKSDRWAVKNKGLVDVTEVVNSDAHQEELSALKRQSENALSQTAGMKWGPYEREKLNNLYWELDRPKRPGADALNDHLHLYAKRHRVLFKNRPTEEIVDRVRYMLRFNIFKEKDEAQYWSEKKGERDRILGRGMGEENSALDDAKLASRRMSEALLMRRRKKMQSPFVTKTSHFTTAPSWTIASINDDLKKATISDKFQGESNFGESEPPDCSSIGVQLLSHNKSTHGMSFMQAGTRPDDFKDPGRIEPSSTTYRPRDAITREKSPAWGLVGRIETGQGPDEKFKSFTGPGSYEEGGGHGSQVLSHRKSAPNPVFSEDERSKHLGNLGQFALG